MTKKHAAILARIYRVADAAYNGGEGMIGKFHNGGGDGLAAFIEREIRSTFDAKGTLTEAARTARGAIDKARAELQAVGHALDLLASPRWWRCRDCGSLAVQCEAYAEMNAPGAVEWSECNSHYCPDCEDPDVRVCQVDAENNCAFHSYRHGGGSGPEPFTKCRNMTDDELIERCREQHDERINVGDSPPCNYCADLIALKLPEVTA